MDYNSFHCKIEITRYLQNNITGEDIVTSTFERFFNDTPTSSITIGSSLKSSIVVENISDAHCSFNFQQDTLFIKASDDLTIIHEENNIFLKKDDTYHLEFSPNELVDFYRLLDWNIKIGPHLSLKGSVVLEEGIEKESIENYLIERYGFAEKLHESERHLVYKVAENKIAKLLHPYYSKNHMHIEKFSNTTKKLQNIDNDILCKVHATYSDFAHAILEFFPGETLGNYLAKKGIVSHREAFMVITKIAEMLKKTKEKGYICKNLSLKNILCAGSKKIKFIGWNIEKYEDNLDDPESIFLAPECFEKNTLLSFAADIYSLGVITFQLITGKPLFSTPQEYRNHISNRISLSSKDLQIKSAHITPQVSIFLELMLSMEPETRPTPSGVFDWIKDIFDIKLWKSVLNMEKEKVYFGLQIISSVKAIQGEICMLQDNKSFIIGRQADINIPGDYRISRKHTKISLDEGICFLEDLGSSNGTKIDDEKVVACKLENGTSFLIGETVLCFWDYKQLKLERQKLRAEGV